MALDALPVSGGKLQTALDVARKGLRVIPVRGKVAVLQNWPELHLGETDLRDFDRRGFNFAAVTGDPLVVLDTDTDQADAWVRERGIESPVMVRSGGGGLHRYFRRPEGQEIRSRSGMHRIKGLDVKSLRSYIVLPGSVHPRTGQPYAFLPGRELRDLWKLPRFDPSWTEGIRVEPFPQPRIEHPGRSRGRIRDICAYLLKVESVEGEHGSNGCYRACCILRDEGYSPLDAWSLLLWWNERVPQPRWPLDQLVHKLESVYRMRLRDVLLR